MNFMRHPRAGVLATPTRWLLLGVAVTSLGCSDLLQVDDPEFATEEIISNPNAVPVVVAGAVGDFQVAYNGGGLDDWYTNTVAALTDEMIAAGTFTTRVATDKRDQFAIDQGNTTDDTFEWLQRARNSIERAITAVETNFGADDERIAMLQSLRGYVFTALAEGFCSPIPFSDLVGGEFVYLDPLSTTVTLDSAVAQFDAALGVVDDYHLAAVGKGRALLSIGTDRLDDAAAAVANVPTTFVHFVEHSSNTGRQENAIYNLNISNGRYSVANNEGTNGAPFRSALDPRVLWELDDLDGVGFDGTTPLYNDLLYPLPGSDLPLASGVEARLIEAEAALQANDVATFLDKLNDLRDSASVLLPLLWEDYDVGLADAEVTFQPLTPLTDPGSTDARRRLLLQERGFWMYGTGHRLGDFRRFIRMYGYTQNQLFPIGSYHKGGEYGDDVAFPIPFEEANNPNWNEDMCDVDQA